MSAEKEEKTTAILTANLGAVIKELMNIEGFSGIEVVAHFKEGEDYGFRYKFQKDIQVQADWTEMKT